MARATIARLTGFTFLLYIAASIVGANLFARITRGDGIATKFADIAAHGPQMWLCFLLALLTVFAALILAVALYALTRDEDADLALFALTCRVAEGVLNAIPAMAMIALLSIARQTSAVTGLDAAASNALGTSLLRLQGWSVIVSAPLFGVGSALYYYLFARARSVPPLLAYFGVFSSTVLVIAIPLEPLQILNGPMAFYIWLPSLLFELIFAPWLVMKGVAAPNEPLNEHDEI